MAPYQDQYQQASAELAQMNQAIAGMQQIKDGYASVSKGDQEMCANEIKLNNAE